MTHSATQVIIDTDPGIDDAIALLFALCSPAIKVLAITTVSGNIGLARTTENAGRIAALAGSSPPVHPGAAQPLKGAAINEQRIHGDDGLGGVSFPPPLASPSATGASEAMAELLMAHPAGSIDLLMLGPMTNLADLLHTAPQAAGRLRRVIAMGGALEVAGNVGQLAEFNIKWDTEAAGRVLAAGLDLTLIPLDTTRQIRADLAYLAQLRATGSPAAVAVADLIAAYIDKQTPTAQAIQSRPLHDPCVPLFLCAPQLFEHETHSLDIDRTTGALISGPYPVQVTRGLDADAARALLLKGVSRPANQPYPLPVTDLTEDKCDAS